MTTATKTLIIFCDLFVILLTTGGIVQKQDFPQSTTNYELRNLQPSTEYVITLFTLYDGREEATFFSTKSTGQKNNLMETNCLKFTIAVIVETTSEKYFSKFTQIIIFISFI